MLTHLPHKRLSGLTSYSVHHGKWTRWERLRLDRPGPANRACGVGLDDSHGAEGSVGQKTLRR